MTMPADLDGRAARKPLTGFHVFLWMAGFFGFMFVVNGIFLWKALATFPGEETRNAYVLGLDYNTTLAARKLQAERGWRAEIGTIGDVQAPQLEIRLLDRAGGPLPVQSAEITLHHKTVAPQALVLTHGEARDGILKATEHSLASGKWEITVRATLTPAHDSALFTATKTLDVP